MRAGTNDTSAVVEVWGRGAVLQELHVPKALHGAVYNDGWFGAGAAWSPDESRVAYVAEVGGGVVVVSVEGLGCTGAVVGWGHGWCRCLHGVCHTACASCSTCPAQHNTGPPNPNTRHTCCFLSPSFLSLPPMSPLQAPAAARTPEWGARLGPDGKKVEGAAPKGWRGVGEWSEDWGELNTGE